MPRPKRHVNGLEPPPEGEPLWIVLARDPKNFVCRCGRILLRTPALDKRGYCYDKTKLGHDAIGDGPESSSAGQTDDEHFSQDLSESESDVSDERTTAEVSGNEISQSLQTSPDRPTVSGEVT